MKNLFSTNKKPTTDVESKSGPAIGSSSKDPIRLYDDNDDNKKFAQIRGRERSKEDTVFAEYTDIFHSTSDDHVKGRALYRIGLLYKNGKCGVKKDPAKALAYFELALEKLSQ